MATDGPKIFLSGVSFTYQKVEADLGLLQHPRWSSLCLLRTKSYSDAVGTWEDDLISQLLLRWRFTNNKV